MQRFDQPPGRRERRTRGHSALQNVEHVAADERAEGQTQAGRLGVAEVPFRAGQPVHLMPVLDVHVRPTMDARPEQHLAGPEATRSRAPEQGEQRPAHAGPRPFWIVVASYDHDGMAGPAPRGERAEHAPVGGGDHAQLPDRAGFVAAEPEAALPARKAAVGGGAQPLGGAAHPGGAEQQPPCGDAPGRVGQANHAEEVERVAVEHELEPSAAAYAPHLQAAQPARELAIVEEMLARDATTHRRRALTQMQVADDDETVGRLGLAALVSRHRSVRSPRYAGQFTCPAREGIECGRGATGGVARRRQSRTARASATAFTAWWCSDVKPAGTSESTSSCPRMVRPRRIKTTNSDLVSRLQA